MLLAGLPGCNSPGVSTPGPRPIQRFIDPTVHLNEWNWEDPERLQVLEQETDRPPYNQTLVQMDKLWRRAFVLNPGQQFEMDLGSCGSGTLEFSAIGAQKNNVPGDYKITLDVALISGNARIERRIELPVTKSVSAQWNDVAIPVKNTQGPVTWSITVDSDPRPETPGTVHTFIGSPVFIPDRIRKQPHVILLAFDSLRADELGAYGSPNANTGTMDVLSRMGTLFSQSYSSSSWTLPGVQNMMSGIYMHRYLGEAQSFHLSRDFKIPLVQSEFAGAGYFTIAVSANHLVSPEHGIDLGFDVFDTKASEHWDTWSTVPLYHRINELLTQYADRPLFVYIHAMDPHDPYLPVEPFDAICNPPDDAMVRARIRQKDSGYLNRPSFRESLFPLTETENEYLRANYRGEIRQMDTFLHTIMDCFDAQGLMDNLVFAVSADHAEEFGEHTYYQHGFTLNESVVRVPLMVINFAKKHSPEIIDRRVSTIDLPPTLCHLAGIDTRAPFEGIDLFASEGAYDPHRLIYTVMQSNDQPELPRWRTRSIYQGDRKLTWQSRHTITAYNLEQGPDESVYWEYPDWETFFSGGIDSGWRFMGEQLQLFNDSLVGKQSRKQDRNLQQKLRDLGYIE